MSIKIRNILISPGIADSGLFTDEPYRGDNGQKTRRIFDLEKILPVPKELQVDHSLQNEMRLLYYFLNGEMESKTLPADFKATLDYDWLERREDPEDLYEATRDFTADMSYQRRARFLEDGEALAINLKEYGATDWYEWRRANWGCAGNTSDLTIINEDEISFCTPDFPPDRAIEALAFEETPVSLSADSSHIWFPDEYGAIGPCPAGRCDYHHTKDGRVEVTRQTYDEKSLFGLYYAYSDNALDARKMSSAKDDRLYFNMDARLFKEFSDLCRTMCVTVTQALTDMIHETINAAEIPFDMNDTIPLPDTGPRDTSHSNVRIQVRERSRFADIVRKEGFSMNKVITTYMLHCLAKKSLPCTKMEPKTGEKTAS